MKNSKMLITLCLLAGLLNSTIPAFSADMAAQEKDGRILLSANEGEVQKVGDIDALKGHIYASYTGRKYILGPNDVIGISVYDAPEFSAEGMLVQPDGRITLAPFGSVNVSGMTIDELQQEMADRLKFYLNDPRVTIKLEKTKPFMVYISGAVVKPGSYEMVTDVTTNQMMQNSVPEIFLQRKLPLLSNVLVAAGGLSHDADLEHVRIDNKFDGSSYEVNLLELIQSGDSGQDMFLVAGDTVTVPRLQSAFAVDEEKYKAVKGSSIFQRTIPVRVYGYVNQPGLVRLDSAQGTNLNSAVAAAGGYLRERELSSSYAPKEILVSRVDNNGQLVTRRVDPRHEDMTLYPNDVVYVPEKTVPRVGKAFDYAGRLIMPVAGIASLFNNWSLMFDPTRFNTSVPR